MGRIADALRRAEQERQTRSAATAPTLPIVDAPAELQASSRRSDGTTARLPSIGDVDEALVAFHDRGAPITEAYRSLRTRLLTANPNKDHQVIAVTSATPKEGKSVSALNLCAVLAEVRHLKILAVDADLRYSSLATMLGLPPAPGLASVLNGATKYNDVVQRTPLPNFDLLPAGETAECAASALLTSSLLPALLNQARKDYDYTIVDTPAAAQGTDVGMIGQLCNGAIMVVRLHRTQEAAAKRAVRLLQVNNVPILGCVLIGRDSTTAQPGGYSAAGYAGSRQKRQRPSRKRPSRAGTEGSTL